jgi:hypothetical protein
MIVKTHNFSCGFFNFNLRARVRVEPRQGFDICSIVKQFGFFVLAATNIEPLTGFGLFVSRYYKYGTPDGVQLSF